MDSNTWNSTIARLPGAHILQTWEWAQVKESNGWQPVYCQWSLASALVLQRAIPIRGFAARLSVMYVPKGPLLDWQDKDLRLRVLDDLAQLARRKGAIFIKIDPDVLLGAGIPGSADAVEHELGQAIVADLKGRGWIFSREQVQFRNTVVIDLEPPEQELLARMKQKTRYNIRLAERKGVSVRVGGVQDLPLLYRMYAETSLRDGFVIRDEAYYQRLWGVFMKNLPEAVASRSTGPVSLPAAGDSGVASQAPASIPCAEPLIAEVGGEPVGAVLLFRFAGRAWYLFGMSRDLHREAMPNYLLQWEAIRRAKAAGCQTYDLWGAPDEFIESDPMWGVYRFKEGLGGRVERHIGAWDLPVRPLYYRLYTQTLPRLLNLMRRRGKTETRRAMSV